MCVVSAIYDYGRNMDPNTWNRDTLDEFHKLLESAKEFDKIAKQPDCEDPTKRVFLEVIESRLSDDEEFWWYEGEVDDNVLRTIFKIQKTYDSKNNE